MNDSRFLISLTVLSLVLSPMPLLAEESTGEETATTPGTETTLTPLPARNMEGRMVPFGATGTKPLVRPNIVSPQGGASGLPAGKLMQGSGTPQVLPGRAKEMMEKRDIMMGSGTPPRFASGTPMKMGTGTPMMGGRMEDRMKDAREKLGKDRGEQAKEFVRITMSRLRAAIDRMIKIVERVESRIAKLESEGTDVSNSRTAIETAKQEIEKAKSALEEAETAFSSYVPPTIGGTSTATPERLQPGMGQPSPVRDALKEAGEAVKRAHKALTDAIKELGVGKVKTEGATTTTSTN